jgi:phospholipid/cholesterol/gamma-HCH transport system permease protein
MRSYFGLCLEVLRWLALAPFRRGILKPSDLIHQMVAIGTRAVPMVALTAFSIGFTLAMQASNELEKLGATMFVPDLVSLSLLRELGPVLIAVIVIGRSASAVTAELGTMKVSEEIEALEVMAIDPVRFLVVPRVAAMMVMLPVLTVFGNCIGMLGGWTVCNGFLGIGTAQYIVRTVAAADTWDLYSGLIKSVAFAWLVSTIACRCGLAVEGGAAGVGRSTTASVVRCLLTMLVANAVLTAIFFFAE